jgi:hypothetical protein
MRQRHAGDGAELPGDAPPAVSLWLSNGHLRRREQTPPLLRAKAWKHAAAPAICTVWILHKHRRPVQRKRRVKRALAIA